MNRLFKNTLKTAALTACTFTLAGCFNNMSGLDDGTTRNSQTNSTLNDSGFANETGPIDTAAVLIGAYRDTATPSDTGLLIDLEKSLTATLGAPAVQSILDTIDGNTAMQAREVRIHVAGYQVKATTTLGALAANNSKKLRNIMNIRPRFSRVDLTTSSLEVPASPSTIQLANTNKTIVTYGGKIEGDFVHRMMVMITYAGANGSFLPNASIPNYGDGFPVASPEELAGSVKLIRISAAIRDQFANLMKAPQDASRFSTVPDTIRNITQTYGSMALAVHLRMKPDGSGPVLDAQTANPEIDAAYFININPAVTSGPEIFPYCHSGYDTQDLTFTYTPAGAPAPVDYDYTHPLACNCSPSATSVCQALAADGVSPLPPTSAFVDTWPSLGDAATKKKSSLIAAQMAVSTPPNVVELIPLTSTITVNGFTLTHE